MDQARDSSDKNQLAEAIRTACLQAGLDAYEDASIRGLCHEGAWECAVGAIQSLDVEDILQKQADQEE
jgi:hypothetical protein